MRVERDGLYVGGCIEAGEGRLVVLGQIQVVGNYLILSMISMRELIFDHLNLSLLSACVRGGG